MTYFRPETKAEVTDRLAELTGLAVGLGALIYGASLAQSFSAPAITMTLDAIRMVCGILVLAVYLPLMIWFKTRFSGVVLTPWRSDSFMGAALKRAGLTAFAAGVLLMVALSTFDRSILSRMTADSVIDLVLAVSLLVFAVSFIVFGRDEPA